jgi:hypothetical protein
MEKLGSNWADFHEIWFWSIFRKTVQEIEVLLKSDKNGGYFTWRPTHFFLSRPAQLFLEREMFQTKVVEKIKTHILCSVTFPRKSCRLWDSVEKYATDRQATVDNIIWRIACCITKAAGTHSEYVMLIDFPRQQWLRESASLWYIACIVELY